MYGTSKRNTESCTGQWEPGEIARNTNSYDRSESYDFRGGGFALKQTQKLPSNLCLLFQEHPLKLRESDFVDARYFYYPAGNQPPQTAGRLHPRLAAAFRKFRNRLTPARDALSCDFPLGLPSSRRLNSPNRKTLERSGGTTTFLD